MNEKFTVGDKVFLIHLQEEAEVTRLAGMDMVYVKVDDMEIPVYTGDITKEIPGRIEAKKEVYVEKNIEGTEGDKKPSWIKSDSGIYLAFEPQKDKSGDIMKFKISLVNDTAYTVSFNYQCTFFDGFNFYLEKVELPYQVFFLHEIEYDSLNDVPYVELAVRDIMNNGFKGKLSQKIKPQNFFNKLGKMPLSGAESYLYKVHLDIVPTKQELKETNKKVTFDPDVLKQMMMEIPPDKDWKISSAEEEIDLHIEALTKEAHVMDNAEMIHLQLGKFQQALERAIANGIDKFYVIHGIGSGRLKKEIHRVLRNYKEVKSFNNNYHPRYGYGATEIILK